MSARAEKGVIFYHANCVDGFAAAHLIERHILCGNVQVPILVPVQYGQVETQEQFDALYGYMLQNAEAIIVDFSFPHAVMDHIAKTAQKTYWLDHHKTAFEEMKFDINTRYDLWAGPNFYLVLDNSKCGAMLAWEFVNGVGAEAPDFIKVVDDYDRWVFQYPQTKDAQMYIRSHSMDRLAFDSLMLMSMDEMAQAGGMMRQYYSAQLEAHKKRQPMYVNFNDQPGLALNADAAFSSELGHYLAEKSKTFGAVYQVEGTKIKFSLRSCGDYDVSALAKIFGGGGHKNAAGFTCAAYVFFLQDGVL